MLLVLDSLRGPNLNASKAAKIAQSEFCFGTRTNP